MTGIVDYGCGNLFSLVSSFEHIGEKAEVCNTAEQLYKCERIVLPGVGAFGDAAKKLAACKLDAVVKKISESTPLLGICLGMQLLFDKSFEYGEHDGLGLIQGEVRPLEGYISKGGKIPQMGWNALGFEKPSRLFKYINNGDYVYFVHSYHAVTPARYVTASVDHGGTVTAAVEYGNVFGTQFHPEKSGEVGLKILKAFTEL